MHARKAKNDDEGKRANPLFSGQINVPKLSSPERLSDVEIVQRPSFRLRSWNLRMSLQNQNKIQIIMFQKYLKPPYPKLLTLKTLEIQPDTPLSESQVLKQSESKINGRKKKPTFPNQRNGNKTLDLETREILGTKKNYSDTRARFPSIHLLLLLILWKNRHERERERRKREKQWERDEWNGRAKKRRV